LPPGGRALVVRDLLTFNTIYGSGLPVAGVFTNNSALDNSGDHLKLEDANNDTISEFSYDDVPPWPISADGAGYSLVLIQPETKPDPAIPTNWRSSALPGGYPGATDIVPFPADPSGDANGNGQPDLLDYAFGNDLGKPPIFPGMALQPGASGGLSILRFSYSQSIGAERARIEILSSTDLVTWEAASSAPGTVSTQELGDGRILLNWDVQPPLATEPQIYLVLRVTAE